MLLPFFAAVGHDIYFNYFSDEEKIKQVQKLRINPEEYLVSDMGWVWQKYHPASMQMARDAIEPEIWMQEVDPILQLPTMVVGLVPFFLACIFLLLTFVLGVWPYTRYGKIRKSKEEDFAVYKHAKTNTMKYTKK
jgi:hypothetical protein